MAENCIWIPSVITEEGKERESQLFRDLEKLHNKDRSRTVKDYGYLTSPYFKEKYGYMLSVDDGGEFVLSEVMQNGLLDKMRLLDSLNNQIGGIKEGKRIYLPDTTDNYINLSKQAIDFNNENPNRERFVALVNVKDNNITLAVHERNQENEILATKQYKNYLLNEQIRTILSRSNISIDTLNQLQDDLKNSTGIVDYQNAETTAEGLLTLIRIADGSQGEKALPEEFAHLMIDLMGDEPLIQRLLNLASTAKEEILGEEYKQYDDLYNGDTKRLAREAAGKLVYRALMGQNVPKKHESFLTRVINRIKEFIKKTFDADEIHNAMNQAEITAQQVAEHILDDNKVLKIEREGLKRFTNLHQLTQEATKAADIVQSSIDKSVKKASFYVSQLYNQIRTAPETSTDPNIKTKNYYTRVLEEYQDKMSKFIEQQRQYLKEKQYTIGVENYIANAATELEKAVERLTACVNNKLSLQEKAFQLVNVLRIIQSNESIVDELTVANSYEDKDFVLSDATEKRLSELKANLKTAKTQYNDQALLTFANYLEKYFKHTINKGEKTISKENLIDILKTADKDMSQMETWLLSAADSGDIIIQLSDQALKDSKERKRQRVLSITKRLTAAANKLSSKNTEFMFERHSDGSIAGRYISSINWTKFKEERKKMYDQANEKYGKLAKGQAAADKIEFIRAWYRENTTNEGNPNIKYFVDVEKKLTPEQYEYYKEFMSIRDELVSLLPKKIYDGDPYKAVQVNKDLWERIKTTSPSKWTQQTMQAMKNSIITTVDENMFGQKGGITDFAGNEVFSVPIYFVKNVEESDLSLDTVSTLAAFADMAVNYDEMQAIADYLELGRDVISQRKSEVSRGKNPVVEKINKFGEKIVNPVKKNDNNFVTRYNELLKTQLYGRYMNSGTLYEGKGYEITWNKAAKLLNRVSSLNQLALNALAGVAAIANDVINVESEALAGKLNGGIYFKNKHLATADAIYLKELPKVLDELGKNIKTSKLSLFIEKFDVLHEYDTKIRDIDWNKSRIKKLASSNALYIFMHMGSHWGETRTALAQAQNIMITSDDGLHQKSLWDILVPIPIDAAHPENGYTLETEKGYTLTEEDITKYTRRFMGFNERMFGAYNLADRNALQSTAVGQLIFLYRKFMVPAILRRFGKASFNFDLDSETEGYYRSAFNFLRDLVMDSKQLGRNIKMYWNQMSDYQKGNCMQVVNELGMAGLLSIFISVITAADWDKKDNPWYRRFLSYMSRRARTELLAFTPFGIFGETKQLIKSPAAAMNTLDRLGDLFHILEPWNWYGDRAIVQQGRYKGQKRGVKYIMESPLVPMNRTVYKVFHPEESLVAFR